MRNPSLLKREFLKKWMMGLRKYTSSNQNMTVTERKKAIKLSAEIALASSRNCGTRWSRAVIAGAAGDEGRVKKQSSWSCWNMMKRRRRRRRRRGVWGRNNCRKAAEWIAERLVEKRTKVLRRLVPGGEFMDDTSLIEETLDYMSALQAQVDVMRCLATAYVPSS